MKVLIRHVIRIPSVLSTKDFCQGQLKIPSDTLWFSTRVLGHLEISDFPRGTGEVSPLRFSNETGQHDFVLPEWDLLV